MTALCLPSPAKINLFLHVIGRRTDGYHLLQTAFQFLNFYDEMEFAPRGDKKLNLVTKGLNLPSADNLVTKAAYLLQNFSQCNQGADIFLNKKIPLGGGLGGGSSNAATTLLALNHLWQTDLNIPKLAELGVTLGADVPIFIYGKAAFAEGIGDIFQAITPPEDWILLVMPGCITDTQKIFSDSQLTRNTPEITIAKFFENGGHNDCEPIARKHFPAIAKALDWLNQHAYAKMTGTGSSVFASFKTKEAAIETARKIPASLTGIVTKGINFSPLYSTIEKLNWGVAKR